MIPNFALALSFDAITLLRRMGPRWARIEEVSLDHEDFDSAVIALRDRAESLDPNGAQVALIIPNEQIRYLDQPDLGGDDAARDVAIRSALDGATPYRVADLTWDHLVSGGRLQIAAVARKTLQEAQSFAREHGFEPVCFLAQAPEGAYDGAVLFGRAKGWKRAVNRPSRPIEIVPAGKAALTPLRDAEPVAAQAPQASAETPRAPEAETDISAPEAAPATTEPASPDPAQAPSAAAAPELAEKGPEPTAVSKDAAAPDAARPAPQHAPGRPAPAPSGADTDMPAPAGAPAAPVTFSTIRAGSGAPALGPAPTPGPAAMGGLKPRFTPVLTPEPEAPAEAPAEQDSGEKPGFFAKPTASAILAKAAAAVAELEEDDQPVPGPQARKTLPPKPLSAPQKKPPMGPVKKPPMAADKKPPMAPDRSAGRAARKKMPTMAAARAAGLAAAPPPPPKDEILAQAANARPGAASTDSGLPRRPAAQPNPLAKLAKLRDAKAKAPAGEAPARATASPPAVGPAFNSPSERERMTVFGARDRDMTGGKPRFLGLMLTGVLLMFLVGVAAWASVFLDEGLARLFGKDAAEPAVAALPESAPDPSDGGDGVVLESAAVMAPESSARPVARPEGGVKLAAFDTQAEPPDPLAAPLSVPEAPQALTVDEAAATYAATGIWQRSPAAPMTPPADGVEDVYAASIDPDIQIFDAVALPDPAPMAPEANLQDPGLPPPAGLTFDFDERNLVRATPEGALTPEGLRVFTGRPPVIPPLRGETESLAPSVTGPGAIVARLEAMPRIRPETRPGDVIEQRERAELGGITLDELGEIRPVVRPPTVQEQAEIDAPDATDQAVVRSLVPVGRPRDMASIVDRADPSIAPEPVQTASIAPRTVAPTVPSSASVARAATSENAINLSRINLIGIYGTAENRRALVRLANGKYQKVKVGDRLDGGQVTAIGDETLRYTKGSRNLTLEMPRG